MNHLLHTRLSHVFRVSCTVLLAALPVSGTAAADTVVIEGPADVIDGDGLGIGPVEMRVHGIDAPEAGQKCPDSTGGT